MDTKRLRYFVAAAEEENLRRAAQRLHIVQPALSKQIAQLEAELGCALFTRSKQRIHLTHSGRIFLDDARRLLRDFELAKERLAQSAAGHLGTLRIGFRETAAQSPQVSRSISAFRASHPTVELRLNQMNSPAQCAALRNGELDAGFIYLSPEHDTGLQRLPLQTDLFYLAVHRNHPLAQAPSIHLRDLANAAFIWLARSSNAYYSDALRRECLRSGFTPKIIKEADSDATALNLVAVGMGVAFVVATASPPPDVALRPVTGLHSTLTLALAWSDEAPSQLLAHFVDTVRRIQTEHTAATDGGASHPL